MYTINQNSKIPLHMQLYSQIKNDIILNYTVNEKLNSIRKMCQTYNLSKNTIEQAYSQLVAEGYIQSYPRSGYRVCECNYEVSNTNMSYIETKEIKTKSYKYDFYPARLAKDSFPLKIWKKLMYKVVDETVHLGMYTDPQGDNDLRIELSLYLKESRAVISNENQIIILSGFTSCMNLLAIILKNTHNSIAIENPGYNVVHNVFSNINYNIKNISLNKNGILIDELKKTNSNLVYLTPAHQYPTGVTIPIKNRLEILKWANETDSFIIEDDYDSELNYINKPIPSLQGLDINDKVIYVGTFSKSLSPSLRVSYMVLPNCLLKKYNDLKYTYRTGVPLMMQKTLQIFINDGYWDKHLRKIRTLNKKKHNIMKQILEQKLGATLIILSYGAGLSMPIKANVNFDYKRLETKCDKKGIKIYSHQNDANTSYDSIRMGFGGLSESDLKDALYIFCDIWMDCIIKND